MKGIGIRSLRARLLLLVLLALLPALALILYSAAQQRRVAAVSAQRRAVELARLASNDQERLIEGAHQLLVTFSELSEVRSLVADRPEPAQQQACGRLFARLVELYHSYSNFGVVELDGDVVCSALPARRGANLGSRPAIQRVLTTRRFVVGEYQVDSLTGKPTITVAYPIREPGGGIAGVVFAAFDLDWLNQFAAEAELPPGATLTLIDRNGTVLARHPDPEGWIGREVPDAPVVRAVLDQRGEGVAHARGIDGEPRLYGFTPAERVLGGEDVYVSVGIPDEVAFAASNRLLRFNLFGLGMVGLLTLAAGWFGGDFFVLRRVRALVGASERLRGGDLHARSNLGDGGDELGQLGRTFDEMAESLQDRIEEIVRYRGEAEEVARRATFLGEASRILASSLDYRTTLDHVARLAVPVVADWCVVDVAEDGAIHRVKVAHADPEKAGLARVLAERYPPDPAWEDHPTVEVLRTGEPILLSEASDEHLRHIARDDEHLRVLRGLGVRSFMAVPMTVRGQAVGAILFAGTRDDRRYGPDDLVLAMELAGRAAMAVENARLYETAVLADRAKGDFLAVMSHELRTPLNAVIGFADLLEAEITGPLSEPQKGQVGRIKANARHLLELINEILTYARMETGREDVHWQDEVDLSEVAQETVEACGASAEAKGLALHLDLPEERVVARTDPDKVRRILMHLVSNAVKFTDRGEVALRVREEEGSAVLRVRDTGIGIAPGHQEKVFDPFWQEQAALTRYVGGTGLGLTVARRLARSLGGDLTVESEPGKGSTFTVRFPTRRA